MDSTRLVVTCTIISRESIRKNITHSKYVRDLSKIYNDLEPFHLLPIDFKAEETYP